MVWKCYKKLRIGFKNVYGNSVKNDSLAFLSYNNIIFMVGINANNISNKQTNKQTNMKELVPNKKSLLIPFAASVQESLDKIDLDKDKLHMADGCIFEDGKFACISKGSVVEILNVKTGLRTSACDFTTSDEKLIVTCFKPFKSKLMIGLRCGDNPRNGVICIYDPGISRVTKTIKLPTVPISIAVIREFGGASYETSLFRYMLELLNYANIFQNYANTCENIFLLIGRHFVVY